jgi:DNA-binding response OmpR family regulator
MRERIRILLVEDDPDLRAIYMMTISMCGYNVTAVEHADDAVFHLEHNGFHLLLTDWQLPGMQGDALVTLVKQRFSAVKTLLMSHHDHVNEAARACGADAWYRKTWDMHRLRQLVDALFVAEAPTDDDVE